MSKSPKKILILSSYPIAQPRHGGQKRVQAVVTEYQKHFKQVRFVAIFSPWAHPYHHATDISISHAADAAVIENRELEEIITAEAIMTDSSVKRRLSHLLQQYQPDVIQLEQVYLYIGLKPLLAELGITAQLVYDSHNVEFQMKQRMYETAGLSSESNQALIQRLTALEKDLVQNAALVAAVSASDRNIYESLGATRLVVAHNGIYPSRSAAASRTYWRKYFAEQQIAKKVLYVSSAHLPNWTGFLEAVGDGLGFLAPDARILIAGGLSDYLQDVYEWPKTPGAATFWNRAIALGSLSEDSLAGLLATTDVIILPITSGGGSNLKTAEALLSGKSIVATSYAFRSYEPFMTYPNVTIADTPATFRQGILDALGTKPQTLTKPQHEALQAVTWPNSLADLIAGVQAL